jgi:hypothetical protein
LDCGVDSLIKLDDSIVGPKGLTDLLAQHDFAWPVHEHQQDPKRLLMKTNLDSVFA